MSEPINVLPALAPSRNYHSSGNDHPFRCKQGTFQKKAIEAAMFQDQKIFLVTKKDPQIEDPGFVQLYQVGTVAYIKQVVKLPSTTCCVFLLREKRRAELLGLEQETPYLRAETVLVNEEEEELPRSRCWRQCTEVSEGAVPNLLR